MSRHEKSHIEKGDMQDAARVANRAEREEFHQTEVQENYPAYTTPEGDVYACNAADLKEWPKGTPRGTLAGQRDVADIKHSYIPTTKPKSKRTPRRNTPIDSSSSHPGDPVKHGGEVPVQSVPDLFYMPPTLE